MQLIFAKSALLGLRKLTPIIQRRIINKLRFYIVQKDPLRFADHLKDQSFGPWRFRVGDYRVIFDVIKD